MNTLSDELYMGSAIAQARESLARGDYPVGAVHVIDGELAGEHSNSLQSKNSWGDHAEIQLLLKYSQKIKEAKMKGRNTRIELYSTLEPCLMCLGTALLHRVDRIVFACHDPMGGATSVSLDGLPSFYHRYWPKVSSGVLREESYDMLHRWMIQYKSQVEVWVMIRGLFEDMKITWGKD